MMLQRGGIGISEIVQRSVVLDYVANVGEVEALISGGFEDGEIGVVGDLFVGGVKNGAGDGMRGMLCEEMTAQCWRRRFRTSGWGRRCRGCPR